MLRNWAGGSITGKRKIFKTYSSVLRQDILTITHYNGFKLQSCEFASFQIFDSYVPFRRRGGGTPRMSWLDMFDCSIVVNKLSQIIEICVGLQICQDFGVVQKRSFGA